MTESRQVFCYFFFADFSAADMS